jgi:hypothetical protein
MSHINCCCTDLRCVYASQIAIATEKGPYLHEILRTSAIFMYTRPARKLLNLSGRVLSILVIESPRYVLPNQSYEPPFARPPLAEDGVLPQGKSQPYLAHYLPTSFSRSWKLAAPQAVWRRPRCLFRKILGASSAVCSSARCLSVRSGS